MLGYIIIAVTSGLLGIFLGKCYYKLVDHKESQDTLWMKVNELESRADKLHEQVGKAWLEANKQKVDMENLFGKRA